MKTQARTGFSLVELLAVLAMVGTATVWLLPSLPGLLQSQARRSALDQIFASLSLARSIALSRGRPALWAVAPAGEGWPEDYALRAFAVFRGEQADPGADPFWVQETGWCRLPEGIFFDPATPGSSIPTGWTAPCPLTGQPLNIRGLQFEPEGSLHSGSEAAFVRLNSFRQPHRGTRIGQSDTIQIRPSTGMPRLIPQ
jgi:prepilin-type N-terminal cleavage/methylation domain-containing protein